MKVRAEIGLTDQVDIAVVDSWTSMAMADSDMTAMPSAPTTEAVTPTVVRIGPLRQYRSSRPTISRLNRLLPKASPTARSGLIEEHNRAHPRAQLRQGGGRRQQDDTDEGAPKPRLERDYVRGLGQEVGGYQYDRRGYSQQKPQEGKGHLRVPPQSTGTTMSRHLVTLAPQVEGLFRPSWGPYTTTTPAESGSQVLGAPRRRRLSLGYHSGLFATSRSRRSPHRSRKRP